MAIYDLVFEGGGAKGSAFVGALQVLFSAGHTQRRVIGTSAGAITATLLGAGYSPEEMLAACNETVPGSTDPIFTTFMDAPQSSDFSSEVRDQSQTMELFRRAPLPSFVEKGILNMLLQIDLYRELFSFNECGGFYAGNAFLKWFRGKLQAKGIDPAITWKAFAAETKSDVSVVTSDVTEQEMVVLNSRTAPDCPVAESVRMSMSIPFVWREMIWEDNWGLYRNRSKSGHIFVDGGVLSNFPLALVIERDPEVDEIMGPTDPDAAGTIGLLLDESMPVPGAGVSDTRRPRLRTADRVTRLIDAMMGTSDMEVMRDYPKLICHIPVKGYGTTEFRMSQERMALLIKSGQNAMTDYLQTQSISASAVA
jgi:NTE family protein